MGRQLRQLLLLAAAFLVGVFAALALGAINLGTALGVGQVCFAAMLVYVLMSDGAARRPDDGA
ncbi:MAG TPA: hypothetical protein VMH33_06760 [Solirubrobacterales bacterium]|nr:hypothetical protein [Solirubrobacterales bacterium]